MADWHIYRPDGSLENTIAADEDFVQEYCREHGFTYAERVLESPTEPYNEPVDLLNPLYQQVKANTDRQEFLEDCIAEMAMSVYE